MMVTVMIVANVGGDGGGGGGAAANDGYFYCSYRHLSCEGASAVVVCAAAAPVARAMTPL